MLFEALSSRLEQLIHTSQWSSRSTRPQSSLPVDMVQQNKDYRQVVSELNNYGGSKRDKASPSGSKTRLSPSDSSFKSHMMDKHVEALDLHVVQPKLTSKDRRDFNEFKRAKWVFLSLVEQHFNLPLRPDRALLQDATNLPCAHWLHTSSIYLLKVQAILWAICRLWLPMWALVTRHRRISWSVLLQCSLAAWSPAVSTHALWKCENETEQKISKLKLIILAARSPSHPVKASKVPCPVCHFPGHLVLSMKTFKGDR